MPSPPSSVITINDSSDDEFAQSSTRQSVPILVDSSDESGTDFPKKPPKFSLPAAVINGAKYGKKEEKREEKSMNDDDVAGEEINHLKFADSNGRIYSDVMSFSKLQSQQSEFEILQAQANRVSKPISQNITFNKTVGSKRKASNAGLMPHSDELRSSVLKKTTSRSPFDFESTSSSDDSSYSFADESYTAPATVRAKSMSLKDVVSHERELARQRKENALKRAQRTSNIKKKKLESKSKRSASKSPLMSRKLNNSFVDELDWSESEQTDDNDDDDEDGPYQPESFLDQLSSEPDHEMSSDIEYIPSKPQSRKDQHALRRRNDQNVKMGKAKRGVLSKNPKSKGKDRKNKSRSSSTTSVVQHSKLTQDGPFSTKLTQRRSAQDTVIHNTMWRSVYFDTAPTNLLPLNSDIAPPFDSACDRPLPTYDPDGDLRRKYLLVPELGESTQRISSLSEPEQYITQKDTDTRVVELIQQELPRLRECYQRKVKAILAEARAKIKVYLASHEMRKAQGVPLREESKRLGNVSVLDKSLLNQMKREEPKQMLSLKYFSALGETVAIDEILYSHDVSQLPKIRPLSRCTAYIGLKANIRVEDDPILRHKPYFGEDDDGADIDQAWYDAIEPKSSKLAIGLDGEVNEFLLRFIIRECGATDKVFAALNKVTGLEQDYSDYNELKKLDDSISLTARRMKEAKELIKSKPEELPLAKIVALEPSLRDERGAQKTLVERLAPPPTHFDSNMMRNHAHRGCGLGLRSSIECSELLVTYRDMFCRMCYDYHCLEHGIQHPLPSCRVDPRSPPLHLSAVALAALARKQHDEESKLASNCSESCETTVITVDCADAEDSCNSNDQDDFQRENTNNLDVNDDKGIVAGHVQSETDFEVDTNEELNESRRSRRALTRISSLASRNLIKQVILPSGKKQSRPCREQIYPAVVDKSEYLDDSHYARVSAFVEKSQQPGDRCSNECWKAENSTASDHSADTLKCYSKSLSDTEQALSRKLRVIIGDNPCMISNMMNSTTCKEVGSFLELERRSKLSSLSLMDDVADAHSIHNGRKRSRAMKPRSINNRILLNRTKNNRVNREYEPCNHEGACDSTGCSCMERDHTCERACSCSRDCPNRFPGCRCSLGNCRTKACPCFIAARECNPDLCVTCGASEVPALVFDKERRNMSAVDLGICCNVNILRGLHKKVGVAFSATHGWGAFALEPIKRGEFIYEYHGALLSQDEAERRGSIYDKMTISFLFDVDDDSVVDAIRKGNKSKFANHSTIDKKCKGKVLTVGGQHRISIWAQQDIAKGEELFFDYGYQGETAPDWSQLRIKGQGTKKKVEGQGQTKSK